MVLGCNCDKVVVVALEFSIEAENSRLIDLSRAAAAVVRQTQEDKEAMQKVARKMAATSSRAAWKKVRACVCVCAYMCVETIDCLIV